MAGLRAPGPKEGIPCKGKLASMDPLPYPCSKDRSPRASELGEGKWKTQPPPWEGGTAFTRLAWAPTSGLWAGGNQDLGLVKLREDATGPRVEVLPGKALRNAYKKREG